MADTLPETPAPAALNALTGLGARIALGRGEDERDHTGHTPTLPLAG